MKLECRNISKLYGEGAAASRALDNISFETGEGEFLSVLGPSGCGKSTLLKIIAGLLSPTEGSVHYDGDNRKGPLNSMVFQEHGVFPWMNVIDNVAFGLEMRHVPQKERYAQSMEFLKKVGLAGYATRNPHELSVGMRQRIAIARAFVNDSAILLMDEPFGSLDAQTRLILQDELLKIWSEHKKTVIFVTHDIDEAILLGDRVMVMSSSPGKIREIIDIDFERPRDLGIESTREFIDIRIRIWNILRADVGRSIRGDLYDAGN